MMRRGLAVLVMAALLVPSSLAAEDASCESQLATLPIETIALPDGYSWTTVAPLVIQPSWLLGIERDAGTAQFNPELNAVIACSAEAEAWLTRLGEVSTALGTADKLAVLAIGDATLALRAPEDIESSTALYFARGPFLVMLRGPINQGDMEAIAQAIDAILPQ